MTYKVQGTEVISANAVIFAADTNATDVGDLTQARNSPAGTQN